MHYSPLLPVHIITGLLAILSGTVAMVFRKGSPRHALAGKVFVVAMLTMSSSGAIMAVFKNQPTNILGGSLAFYLVATAWFTARRGDNVTGIFDWIALLAALATAAVEISFGLQAVQSSNGLKDGYPAGLYFTFGSILALSATGDLRMLLRGGVSGTKRIVRHLWRMSFGFFIATGSFFLGQQKVFPVALRGAKIFWVLGLLPLALMIFWLFRVWLSSAFHKKPTAPLTASLRSASL
jgi:hypothetical protein